MKKALTWIKNRIRHKVEHLKPSLLLDTLKENGVALVVIIVGWEIFEDIVLPVLFVWLGNNVHPGFYAGAPASILLCFHWIGVPLLWGAWIKITKHLNRKRT